MQPTVPPGTIAVYGRTKIGKTVDVNRCFQRAVTIETERGATTSVRAFLGREPLRIGCFSITDPEAEVDRVIEGVLPEAVKKHGLSAAILDTGSELADRIFVVEAVRCGNNGMVLYPRVGSIFKTILRKLLALNLWVIAIFHEREPNTIQGRFSRGGPKLPGKLVEDAPGLFDTILHATIASGGGMDLDGGSGAQRVYRCDPLSSEWVAGDRFNATLPEQPMDLRPIMYRAMRRAEPPDELLVQWGHKPEDFARG